MYYQLQHHFHRKHRLPTELYELIISKLNLFFIFDVLGLRDKKQLRRHSQKPDFLELWSQHQHGGYEIKEDGSKKYLDSHLWILCNPVLFEFLIIFYESDMSKENFILLLVKYNRLDLIQISIKYCEESIDFQEMVDYAACFQKFRILDYLDYMGLTSILDQRK